ncbi:MAG TPA: protein kinase, partial [Opitutaceae bacterium]|nr:protein kinase [Opitutaceae bacterium]
GQKVFNRYTLTKILGRGGMGVVWLARDGELERDVALKFLPEVVALDKESLDELKRETRRNLELTHPHIVRIYDFVSDGRSAAISMEYVNGASLSALKTEQPDKIFPVARLAVWVAQICEALEYAHTKAKIVHRDIKPANLMVDARGEIKVTDFGIARSISDSVSRVSAQAGSSGTPVYMSPQQMMGEKAAVSDDVYALGATLYELLTGKPPFHTGNIIVQVQNKVPPTIAARREELGVKGDPVPAHWEAAIAACLAKEPGDRPKDMATLAKLLSATARPAKGEDQHTSLFLSVEEMVTGGPMKVTRRRGAMTLLEEIQVPHGVRSGTILRVPRLGEPGQYGGEPGDLLVTVQLREAGVPRPADPFDAFKEVFDRNSSATQPGQALGAEPTLVPIAPASRAWPVLTCSAVMLVAVIASLLGVWDNMDGEKWRWYDYSALFLWAAATAFMGSWATAGLMARSCWLVFLAGGLLTSVAYMETGVYLNAHEVHRHGSLMLAFQFVGGSVFGLILGGVNSLILGRMDGARRQPGLELFIGLGGGLAVTVAAFVIQPTSAKESFDMGLHSWVVAGGLVWLQTLRLLLVRAPAKPAAKPSRWWMAAAAVIFTAGFGGWYVGLLRPLQDPAAMPKNWDPAALDAMHAIEVPADSTVPGKSDPAYRDGFQPDDDSKAMVRPPEEQERQQIEVEKARVVDARVEISARTTSSGAVALEKSPSKLNNNAPDSGTANEPLRSFVADVSVAGVFWGNPVRVVINGRTFRLGDIVDQDGKIVLLGADPEKKDYNLPRSRRRNADEETVVSMSVRWRPFCFLR